MIVSTQKYFTVKIFQITVYRDHIQNDNLDLYKIMITSTAKQKIVKNKLHVKYYINI